MATVKEPALGRLPYAKFAALRAAVTPSDAEGGRRPGPAPPGPPTPSQAAFLAGLDPDLASRLARAPALRAEVLDWLRDGPDPILEAEALRRLSPAEGPAGVDP